MRFKILLSATVVALLVTLNVTSAAQERRHKLSHYTVTDLGTLGGTFSYAGGLSNSGFVEGYAFVTGDTAKHASLWRHGKVIDLGTLGGTSSTALARPNDGGNAAGGADTPDSDPMGEDFCFHGTYLTCLPFVWEHNHKKMIPLPTLANNGMAMGINNRGEIVGVSENNTVEPTCFPPQVLQSKPVLWKHGKIHELPTFPGDPVGQANAINSYGHAVGWSGDCQMHLHALLWKDGKAIDLGSLGGVMFSQAVDINDRGQIVGTSDTADDFTNDGFLWQRGVMTDLGTLPGDAASTADGINNWGQVVGGSTDDSGNTRATIWQDGVMTDLNTLIPASSPLFLQEATGGINDWGQIAGIGIDSNGDTHAFLLTPTYRDDDHESMGRARPNFSRPQSIRDMRHATRFLKGRAAENQ